MIHTSDTSATPDKPQLGTCGDVTCWGDVPHEKRICLSSKRDWQPLSPPSTPRKENMAQNTPRGWDERDYKLWSDLQQLPSYKKLSTGDHMISFKQVISLLEKHAAERVKP